MLSYHNRNLKWQASVTALGQTRVTALRQTMSQLCVTAQCYLENTGNYILKVWGHDHPKDAKRREEKSGEREGERPSPLPLFISFCLLPLGLPCVTWASQSAVCSPWGPHSRPLTFLCSVFTGFSLHCLLATAILGSFFLF